MIYSQVIKGVSQYVALGKYQPFERKYLTVAAAIIKEPGDLYFEFGETQEQALDNLRQSMEKES